MSTSAAWADDEEDAPPGFDKPKPSGVEEEAAKLADDLKISAKVELDVDEPDLTLRLAEGLREGIAEAQITTQSETMYASASRFEDLPLSPEILEGLYGEMKFERPSKIQAITLPMVRLRKVQPNQASSKFPPMRLVLRFDGTCHAPLTCSLERCLEDVPGSHFCSYFSLRRESPLPLFYHIVPPFSGSHCISHPMPTCMSISHAQVLTPPHKDLIAQAHNGSGKTTCFVLSMIARLDPIQANSDPNGRI
jgi:hypothetical protein